MAETKTTVKAEVPEPLTDWNERFRVRDVRDVSHAAMQVSLALVSEHHGEVQCIGTGFAVAPGLAITAGHVVDGWREYQAKKNREKCSESMFSVSAIQLVGEKFFQWRVDAIYGSASSDIAFLRFQRPTWWGNGAGQVIPPNARLNLNPPAVGDELRVFGFPESKVEENGMLVVSPSELLLAARQAGLAVQEYPNWETLLITWRKSTADAEILDELATLDFRWNGVDLFEVRTYAELSRSGVLPLLSVVSATAEQVPGAPVQGVVAVVLSGCRKGGQQVSLPDGLDRFMDATRHFVRSLLRLSHVQGERQADDTKEAEASGGS